jgi:Domain of unknown function (DUF4157)
MNSRATQKLEQRADQFVEGLRCPDFDVNTNPLAAISEHFIAKSNQNQPTRAFEREQHIVQAVRPAPSNLIRTARASGFKTSQLTSAIQRFTDPTANKAVRTGIMTGLHHSPSLSLEVQRSLEESDANLEVQRQEFMTEAREQENNSSLSDRIAQELNGGQPLEENIRKQLEAHFNTDLSKVRIHTDGKAHELAKKANAIAFTTGKDIFFQSGKYDPSSSSGFELLAHETAHTIQQGLGQVSPGIDSSSGLENQAQLEGQKAVGNRSNLERYANNFNDFILKPKLESLTRIGSHADKGLDGEASRAAIAQENRKTYSGIDMNLDARVLTSFLGKMPVRKYDSVISIVQRRKDPDTTEKKKNKESPKLPISIVYDEKRVFTAKGFPKIKLYELTEADRKSIQESYSKVYEGEIQFNQWADVNGRMKFYLYANQVQGKNQFIYISNGSELKTEGTSISESSPKLSSETLAPTEIKISNDKPTSRSNYEVKYQEVASVNAVGIVFNNGGVNVYAKPNQSGQDQPQSKLEFNQHVLVLREVEGGWYQISTPDAKIGYVNKAFLRVYKNDPGANLHIVKKGQSAIGVAEQYYRQFVQPGTDLRYFINVLALVNSNALKKPNNDNWKSVAFDADTTIYVPGAQHALTYKDQVNDGSFTNGLYAQVTGALGHVGDVIKSVMESPSHVGEVLGELWEVIKEHWVGFVAVTTGLILAEMAVTALAAVPEPTMLTKVLAILLQGLIVLVAGVGAVMSFVEAISQGVTWITTAWTANGNQSKINQASRSFLKMLGNVALFVLAILGVRGSLGKFKGLYTKFKPKLPKVGVEEPTSAPKSNPKNDGLETQGNKPKPGERSQTREEYAAEQSQARLAKLLGEDTLRQIGGRLTREQIEAFIKDLGVDGTKQAVSKFGPDAMAKYGAAFFKNFKGVTNNTMQHLLQNDGIKGGEIKGCHDKSLFLSEISKWGKILSQERNPMDARVERYSYKLFIRNSAGKVEQPPQLLTGSKIPDKTVIDGLIANSSYWKNIGQLAIIRAIRNGTLDTANADFSASAFNLKIRGFYRNGEVQTFWIEW